MFKSRGLFRTIGSALAGIGAALAAVPEPHAQAASLLLLKIGGILGGLGVIRAAASGTLPKI